MIIDFTLRYEPTGKTKVITHHLPDDVNLGNVSYHWSDGRFMEDDAREILFNPESYESRATAEDWHGDQEYVLASAVIRETGAVLCTNDLWDKEAIARNRKDR